MGCLVLQIGDADDDLHRAAFHIIGGRDETAQMRGREIGPGGGQAGVELCHPPLIAGCGADAKVSCDFPVKMGVFMIRKSMTIILTPEQEAWCQAHVAAGAFASVEEAARQLIDERIAERAIEEGDDLAWAKPYVDEARAAVARGDVVTLDEHKARNAARLAAIRT
jgi:antitoxin ParD1/3/4